MDIGKWVDNFVMIGCLVLIAIIIMSFGYILGESMGYLL